MMRRRSDCTASIDAGIVFLTHTRRTQPMRYRSQPFVPQQPGRTDNEVRSAAAAMRARPTKTERRQRGRTLSASRTVVDTTFGTPAAAKLILAHLPSAVKGTSVLINDATMQRDSVNNVRAAFRQALAAAAQGDIRYVGRMVTYLASNASHAFTRLETGRVAFRADAFRTPLSRVRDQLGTLPNELRSVLNSPEVATVLTVLATRAEALAHGEYLSGGVDPSPSLSSLSGAPVARFPEPAAAEPWRVSVCAHALHWADCFALVLLSRIARSCVTEWERRGIDSPERRSALIDMRHQTANLMAMSYAAMLQHANSNAVVIPRSTLTDATRL